MPGIGKLVSTGYTRKYLVAAPPYLHVKKTRDCPTIDSTIILSKISTALTPQNIIVIKYHNTTIKVRCENSSELEAWSLFLTGRKPPTAASEYPDAGEGDESVLNDDDEFTEFVVVERTLSMPDGNGRPVIMMESLSQDQLEPPPPYSVLDQR